MKKDLKIFVIIVAYNGLKWYDRCLSSLRESTIPVTTIVVDNASTDCSVEYIKMHYPEVIIIASKQNLGFGKGNNLALKYALQHDCDYVFLLNQDTWLEDRDAIERLISLSQKYPEYGLLSPIHLTADKKALKMQLEDGNNLCSNTLFSDLYCGSLKEVYETNYVNAAAWLLPRFTLETVGGFDPIYQHYEEDDDYLNRLHYHQLKIGVCPRINIVHDHQTCINPFRTQNNDAYHHHQELIVRLTDVNKSEQVCSFIRYCFRKWVKNLIIGNEKARKRWYEDMLFVKSMKSRIWFSRKMNMNKGRRWLE